MESSKVSLLSFLRLEKKVSALVSFDLVNAGFKTSVLLNCHLLLTSSNVTIHIPNQSLSHIFQQNCHLQIDLLCFENLFMVYVMHRVIVSSYNIKILSVFGRQIGLIFPSSQMASFDCYLIYKITFTIQKY